MHTPNRHDGLPSLIGAQSCVPRQTVSPTDLAVVVVLGLVHELEACIPVGTPGGVTDASAGLWQYRQAEEGGGKASAKAGAEEAAQ